MIPLYILLGAARSGRREVLRDLIENGLSETAGTTAIYLSEDEHPSPFEENLHALSHSAILNYRLEEEFEINAEELPPDTSVVFFVTDGATNPVDQIEALKGWMLPRELDLARIISVIHCQLGQAQSSLFPWFEACVHFSDLILLNKRTGGTEKWVNNFRQHFSKHCYPCDFQLVKKGKIEYPASALYPEPRRLSLAFDDLKDSCTSPNPFEDSPDFREFEESGDEDYEGTGFDPELRPDPYFERLPNGLRAKPLPDIAKYLPHSDQADLAQSEKGA